MGKIRLLSSLVVLAALAFAASALAIDVPLKFIKFPDGATGFVPVGITSLKLALEIPAGEWKLPNWTSEKPLFGLVKIGAAERLLALDRQKAEDTYFNRIYLDANGNRDLTDDPVADGKEDLESRSSYRRVKFGAVDIMIEAEGKVMPYSMRPELMVMNPARYSESQLDQKLLSRFVQCLLRTNCAYSGEFRLDGQTYSVTLTDTNCNGSFTDTFEIRKPPAPRRLPASAQGDSFYISRDGKPETIDRMIYGDWLVIKDKLYRIQISPTTAALTLTPVTENTVPLRLAMLPERLSISTEDGKDCIMMFEPAETVMVPPGQYRLFSYELFKEDAQGDLWRLCATATTDTSYFAAAQGDRALLEFGEPFVPAITIPSVQQAVTIIRQGQTNKLSPRVPLVFNVEGLGKEFVNDISHIRGDKTRIPLSQKEKLRHRPAEPSYVITKSDGEVVTKGFFEYS